ncbi:MAG: methionyl-tRNA formyltransferase [Thermoleophilia bacterium]
MSRVVFAGSPAPAARVFADLCDSPHDVAFAISQPDRRRGRGGTASLTPVAATAADRGIECLRPATINDPDILDRLRSENIDALCVVAFGQLLKAPLLDEWPCINVHFSVLPAYRGAAPVERAVMDGATETGVSIMRMDAGLDTGPVFSITRTPIGASDTAGEVMDRLCELGADGLVEALDALDAGTFAPTPQPEDGVSLAPKIGADDRELDTAMSATELANRIRGLAPHIGVRCEIDGQPFKIWAATPLEAAAPPGLHADGDRLILGCATGSLEITQLQPPSKARMDASAFLRGWRGELELA